MVAKTCGSLAEVRAEIDRIDGVLIGLLAERSAYVAQAALWKTSEAEVEAPDRVAQVIAAVRRRADDAGLPAHVAEAVWRAMIGAFIDFEKQELARTRPGQGG